MKKYLAEMVGTMVLIISILLCSCCPSKQHAVIKADLVKVFDNYPLTSKGDENYTRKIHLVFRITNTTNDTFFIPMQAMGYDCNSKIHFCVDSLKSISFATFYGRVASSHVLLPHDSIDCGISIYQASNPQPLGFRGNLLVKRQKFFYCTSSLGITETS